jgi:hypothetical protein
MAETSNHISTRRRRRLPWTVVGVVALAVGVAGCGGYSSTAAKPAPSGAPQHSAPSASAIPQGNGGDMDADNNGGPDDGDGNQ